MGVSLSIKDVPEALAQRLRERALRNHRSLQRELMAIVEAAASSSSSPAAAPASSPALRSAEPHAAYAAAPGPADDLLAELDRIVAGSRWGHAPMLTRDQLHERALARELDFDAREAELSQARATGLARAG
ncbi:MAG: hypothetical protein ING89_13385 [Rubrivivax sp.]|nr:hypothetical protein [Rubrivivax sp.]